MSSVFQEIIGPSAFGVRMTRCGCQDDERRSLWMTRSECQDDAKREFLKFFKNFQNYPLPCAILIDIFVV